MPRSQTFTDSRPLPMMRLPSALIATSSTPAMSALEEWTSLPVLASHTFTVSSELPETMRLPSGLNATLVAPSVCPLRVEDLLAGAGIPHLHRLVRAARGDAFAVGAERHAVDAAGVPLEGEDFLAGRGVPHLHRLVPAAAEACACRRG